MDYSAEKSVNKLTDAYAKRDGSNNYKIFNILEKEIKEISVTEKTIREMRNIDTATGKTLDLMGEDLKVKRNGLHDEVYKIMLKTRDFMNFGTGSFNNTLELIAKALNCDVKNISITEDYEQGDCASVSIKSLPLSILNNVGMSIQQYEEIVRHILPAGISISSAEVEGTFAFGPNALTVNDVEIDNEIGFADDDQTIGGILGAVIGGKSKWVTLLVRETGTIRLDLDKDNIGERYVDGRTIYILRETMPATFYFFVFNGNVVIACTAILSAEGYTYKACLESNLFFGRTLNESLIGSVYKNDDLGIEVIHTGVMEITEMTFDETSNEWVTKPIDTVDCFSLINAKFSQTEIVKADTTGYNEDGYYVFGPANGYFTQSVNGKAEQILITRKSHDIPNTKYLVIKKEGIGKEEYLTLTVSIGTNLFNISNLVNTDSTNLVCTTNSDNSLVTTKTDSTVDSSGVYKYTFSDDMIGQYVCFSFLATLYTEDSDGFLYGSIVISHETEGELEIPIFQGEQRCRYYLEITENTLPELAGTAAPLYITLRIPAQDTSLEVKLKIEDIQIGDKRVFLDKSEYQFDVESL